MEFFKYFEVRLFQHDQVFDTQISELFENVGTRKMVMHCFLLEALLLSVLNCFFFFFYIRAAGRCKHLNLDNDE